MDVYISDYTTPVTAQFGDRLTHQVPDRNVYLHGDSGAVRALCDEWIIPASMTSPEGSPCAVCAAKIGYRPYRSENERPERQWRRFPR